MKENMDEKKEMKSDKTSSSGFSSVLFPGLIETESENDIIKFSPFDDQFLQILLKNILLTNNSENESSIKIDIDYQGIESELVEKNLLSPHKKAFCFSS